MELTQFAPAERASAESLGSARARLEAEPLLAGLIRSMPNMVVVLNEQRQIVLASTSLLQALGVSDLGCLAGRRPGEAMGCVHADAGPGGCGTSHACSTCGGLQAVLESVEAGRQVSRECRIRSRAAGGTSFDFQVVATPFPVAGQPFTLVDMKDISADKRRGVFERVFFHDVLNTASGLYGLAEAIASEGTDLALQNEYSRLMLRVAEMLIEEIRGQRVLMMAERGEFDPVCSEIRLPDLIAQVEALYRNHTLVEGRNLVVEEAPEISIWTDGSLLRRVLGNLLKNALEATPNGGTVKAGCREIGDEIEFRIHNPGVMPKHVQLQLFQRSFSTKEGTGRGIGTYSVKLLGEKLLKGRVAFTSREPEGTTFIFSLPKKRPE